MSGKVYDESGKTLDGVTVKATSLDANTPYLATTTTSGGAYVFNNVPEGVKLELRAQKAGLTTRSQVDSFFTTSVQPNALDFGGSSARGRAFFLSDRPEVVSTTPSDRDTNVDPSVVTVQMRLSEPLDATNQRRFEDAIRLLPANLAALGEVGATSTRASFVDLEHSGPSPHGNQAGTPVDSADFLYAVGKSVLFLEDSGTRATVTWSSAGDEATLAFNAPLLRSKAAEARYSIALLTSSSAPIQDPQGLPLGTAYGATALDGPQPALNALIHNAFKGVDLDVPQNATTAFERWDATHQNAATFGVTADDRAPELLSASVNTIGNDSRFDLTFNESIVAFNGKPSGHSWWSKNPNDPLGAFTFAVGASTTDLANLDLKGGTSTLAELITKGTVGAHAALVDRVPALSKLGAGGVGSMEAFRLSLSNWHTGARASAPTGANVLEADPRNPKRLYIYVVGRKVTDLFSADMKAIKVRVEGLEDPAGNGISKAIADRFVTVGGITH